jgi:hypothetical protein
MKKGEIADKTLMEYIIFFCHLKKSRVSASTPAD